MSLICRYIILLSSAAWQAVRNVCPHVRFPARPFCPFICQTLASPSTTFRILSAAVCLHSPNLNPNRIRIQRLSKNTHTHTHRDSSHPRLGTWSPLSFVPSFFSPPISRAQFCSLRRARYPRRSPEIPSNQQVPQQPFVAHSMCRVPVVACAAGIRCLILSREAEGGAHLPKPIDRVTGAFPLMTRGQTLWGPASSPATTHRVTSDFKHGP